MKRLIDNRIIVRSMEEYKIKNCLRLSIGNSKENKYLKSCKKFLKMFKNILIIGCGMIGSSILRCD